MITLDMLNNKSPEVKDELIKKLSELSPEDVINLLEIIGATFIASHACAPGSCEDITKATSLMGFDDEINADLHGAAVCRRLAFILN